MNMLELGNERCLGPISILQQPPESRLHIPRLMENGHMHAVWLIPSTVLGSACLCFGLYGHCSTEHKEAECLTIMVKTDPCGCLYAWSGRPELAVGRYVICKGICGYTRGI